MLTILPVDDKSLAACADLLRHSAQQFITPEFEPDAATRFLANENEDKLRSIVNAGGYYAGAWWQQQLTGFVGVRAPDHIVHLFVDQQWHHRGIGTALLHYALASIRLHSRPQRITVNSSTYALAFYQRAGFVCTDLKQCFDGVYYTPMKLIIET